MLYNSAFCSKMHKLPYFNSSFLKSEHGHPLFLIQFWRKHMKSSDLANYFVLFYLHSLLVFLFSLSLSQYSLIPSAFMFSIFLFFNCFVCLFLCSFFSSFLYHSSPLFHLFFICLSKSSSPFSLFLTVSHNFTP